MDDATRLSRCTSCGAELPIDIDSAEGLCPACLMAAALASTPGDPTANDVTVLSDSRRSPAHSTSRLTPGQAFGPYLIGRLLGRGGMGEVYEAEHLEHGRRVALKVLNQRLAGPEDRARFLREGQLAASISHPHTVYIFGSEEIAQTPVISMELVAGGTLKDRVEREGPLRAPAAVDAILDLIAGLDAAQAGGILHRDIKPSNCFVDPDGRVKVGDFGLSISTLARDVSQHAELSGFQGTPQYAAPEQLKGQPLDVRADIYAVGATLYYLLTGRPPFDDRDLMTLVQRATTEAPRSPRTVRRAVPRGLADIVLKCLAKDRSERPAAYAQLEDALRPFSSAAPTPATLGLRAVAGTIDWLLLAAITAPITLAPVLKFTAPASVDFSVSYSGATGRGGTLLAKVLVCMVMFLYYTVLEGTGGASLGKRMCGLRVTHEGRRPGLARASVRTVVFMAPLSWEMLKFNWSPEPPSQGTLDLRMGALLAASFVVDFAIAWIGFTSMRRRNGYAAWHDLASGTRVVLASHSESRTALTLAQESTGPETDGGRVFTAGAQQKIHRLGPFDLGNALGSSGVGELFEGFDPVLVRRVWLHVLPPGTPALAAARRDLGRPGRLHWLAGRRRDAEAWDAYEAPDGAPLSVIARTRHPWRVVRLWLRDLERELHASELDGTRPVLSLDRVWITRASRALLLDFPAPGGEAGRSTASIGPQALLAAVGSAALDAAPIPLFARKTLTDLENDDVPAAQLTRRIAAISSGAALVTPWRRVVPIALANVPLMFVLIAVMAMLPLMSRVMRQDFLLPMNCLIEIGKLDASTDDASLRLRRSLEQYCSARYGHLYRDDGFWSDRRARQITEPLKPVALRVIASHPAVSEADAAAAEADTRATLGEQETTAGARTGLAIAIALPCAAMLICAVLAIVSSLLVRGGVMMTLLGLAIVDGRGVKITRLHGLARALVAWSPILVLWACFGISRLLGRDFEQMFLTIWLVVLTIGTSAVGTIWTIRNPARGWQDRAAGTSIVPR